MLSLGRKASAAPKAETEAAESGGLVLPRLLRKPVRHAMRLFHHGILFSPATLAVASGLIVGGAGTAWLNESGEGERAIAKATALAGFRIADIEIKGVKETSRIDVLTNIDLGAERSLFSFDVHEAREALRKLPWVAEARVAKAYPDRLLVDITERAAFATWQHQGSLVLVERNGAAIIPFDERFAALPLVVGAGANAKAAEFLAIVARHPEIASRVAAYVRVGERRWNLTLSNGMTVLLGETGEERQLAELARLNSQQDLFSRDLLQIDMRIEDRLVLRLTPEAAERRREALGIKAATGRDGA